MAVEHKHERRSAVSSEGSMAPKRRAKQSPKAVSTEPAFEVSSPSKPDVVEIAPPTIEAIRIPPIIESPSRMLGLAKEKPVPESSGRIVQPVNSPKAAADLAPEYLKGLARERIVWGVAVAVSWMVTLVALLRLGII